jgi:ABC-type dipeptide/oligopeptide/nickel transport system permease subunit
MTTVDIELIESVPAGSRPRSRPARMLRALKRQPAAFVAGVILAVIFLAAAIIPSFARSGNYIDLSSAWANHAPTWSHWHLLGTNGIGQDILLRTVYGVHESEQTALFACLLATALGVAIGGIAAYRGGAADALIMRLVDVMSVYPALLLLLAAYVFFAPVTVMKATTILALYLWIPVARVVRAEIFSLRGREFVQAAIASGASDLRIFFRHLLPNAGSTIVIAATALFGQVIMLEATVEFFGLGVSDQQTQTIGNLIGDGQRDVLTQGWGWWGWAGPAAVLVVIVVCANLLGDGIAEALRPTSRR